MLCKKAPYSSFSPSWLQNGDYFALELIMAVVRGEELCDLPLTTLPFGKIKLTLTKVTGERKKVTTYFSCED